LNKLRISPEAAEDLAEISKGWIHNVSEDKSIEIIRRILDRAEQIARFPYSGRSREDLGAGYRSFVEEPYVIYYQVIDIGVELLGVVHGRRDQRRALGLDEA